MSLGQEVNGTKKKILPGVLGILYSSPTFSATVPWNPRVLPEVSSDTLNREQLIINLSCILTINTGRQFSTKYESKESLPHFKMFFSVCREGR